MKIFINTKSHIILSADVVDLVGKMCFKIVRINKLKIDNI